MSPPLNCRQWLPHTWWLLALSCSSSAFGQSQAVTLEDLQRRLAERDRIIVNLQERIEALERAQPGARKPPTVPESAAQTGSLAPPVTPRQEEPATEQATREDAPLVPGVSNPPVDPQRRASERALVREGGLVLPPNTYEIETQLLYEHTSAEAGQVITSDAQGLSQQNRSRQETFETSVGLTAALPWASQIELVIPYAWTRAPTEDGQRRKASGFGDLSLAFSKQLLNERAGRPGLLGTVRWRDAGSATSFANPVALKSSFRSLEGTLNIVKRKDPLLFFGSLGYMASFSRRIAGTLIDPGNATTIRLGSIFALRPDTSMTLSFETSRAGHTRVDGAKLPGSDASVGMFGVGFAYALSPTSLLDVQAEMGLTSNSPDYRLIASIPIRF